MSLLKYEFRGDDVIFADTDGEESWTGHTGYHKLMKMLEPDEDVMGLVIGRISDGQELRDGRARQIPKDLAHRVLTIDEARHTLMNCELTSDFGGDYTPNIIVWTNRRVIFTSGYDGGANLSSVPISPVDCIPARYR